MKMDRITSLERFGYRTCGEFTEEAVRKTRDAGFNAVFINGGSGFGPDSFFVESMLKTEVLPDLLPYTAEYVSAEMHRRIALLKKYDLKPYLCVWDTLGTQCSDFIQCQYLERRTKLELRAKQRRDPELFGKMNSWRTGEPLCISHPTVQAFYHELFSRLPLEYPELSGIYYFPGDFALGICTDECERCKSTGLTQQERMLAHINRLRAALNTTEQGKSVAFYYGFWNMNQPGAAPPVPPGIIDFALERLSPDIGAALAINDNCDVTRQGCPMTYIQPWGTFTERGPFFLHAAELCRKQHRRLMAFSEITQSEQYDPVCVNMPFALKTLNLYRNLAKTPEADAVIDFWGSRPPYYPDACHAVQKCFLAHPDADDDEILRRAAALHYGITENDVHLIDQALSAWKAFDAVIENESLCGWSSRFSYAIGRCGARGTFFRPLIPPFLRNFLHSWGAQQILLFGTTPEVCFAKRQEDAESYRKCSEIFRDLSRCLSEANCHIGAENAGREADHMALYGMLCISAGRFLFSAKLFEDKRFDELRSEIEKEILHRRKIMELSYGLQPFSGVDTALVEEDVMNMALYLSDDSFPDAPDDIFSLTPVTMPL